jgi:poly-gamma-glutamate capsule biosynthesis protein CapA/YwtB (metallophosphatase superfamily)
MTFLSILLFSSVLATQPALSPKPNTVRLVAVGDIMMAGPMAKLMDQKGRGYPFAPLKPTLRQADIAFGNLECSVSVGGEPLEKQFTFQVDPRRVRVLAESGFDIVSLANNHTWDYGRDCLLQTVQNVRKTGVNAVGAGANRAEAHRLVILRRKGLKIGFLAYLGLLPPLVAESPTLPSVAMASVDGIKADVQKAKSQVDVLIVSLHAGEEGSQTITPRQRSFAHAAVDAGAHLVIGHHPHVVQKSELYKGKPIFYSLGNFVFSTSGRGSGALLEADLGANGKVSTKLRRLSLSGGCPHFPSKSKSQQGKRRSKAKPPVVI